jgi:hypothetical protein
VRGRGGTPLGEPAVGCIPSVPPLGAVVLWLGPAARGESLASNSPLGPPLVPHADFCVTGETRNPLGFARWVVPIKDRGRYILYPAIHCAEGVRRVRKGDFWKVRLKARRARAMSPPCCLGRPLGALEPLRPACVFFFKGPETPRTKALGTNRIPAIESTHIGSLCPIERQTHALRASSTKLPLRAPPHRLSKGGTRHRRRRPVAGVFLLLLGRGGGEGG